MDLTKLNDTQRNLSMTLLPGYRYLLLETDLINKPYDKVSAIDFFTTKEWLWNNTFLEQHQEDGPLLVNMEEDSALIPHYLSTWAIKNAAIMLFSPFELDTVMAHLQSIILIMMPDGNQARLRLHEPRKLAGILGALDSETQSSLMGPIEHIIWLENCGQDQSWYQADNKMPHLPVNTGLRWFCFNETQIQSFNRFEESWFIRNLAWKIAEQHNLEINTAQTETEALCKQALKDGFRAEQDITDYCHLQIQHSDKLNTGHCSILLKEQSIPPHARLVRVQRLLRKTA